MSRMKPMSSIGGLVEDEDLDVAQVDRLLLHVVEEAPRCRDEDVDPARSASICGLMPTRR